MMRKELESGGRVFVVYPVIELSEELPELRAAETEFEAITEEFEGFQCGLVHGRMKVLNIAITSSILASRTLILAFYLISITNVDAYLANRFFFACGFPA